eukprot:COSAG01_NODE_53344_length_339_cov_1757.025000_1_plen_56_part_10
MEETEKTVAKAGAVPGGRCRRRRRCHTASCMQSVNDNHITPYIVKGHPSLLRGAGI